MKTPALVAAVFVLVCVGRPALAQDVTFADQSLIIPMDTDYQDDGMFKAFGLVYALLRANVPVAWVIDPDKQPGDADFVVSATDFATGAAVVDHGYRAGPFVVRAEDVAVAEPIVTLWQSSNVTTVHRATVAFQGFVNKELVAAPTIAVFSDGNEDIAFKYLNAAGIPDSLGQVWPDKKQGDAIYPGFPDILNVEEVAGPTETDHADGMLFDGGQPAYCQIMTMHWGVNDVVDEVVAEMRSFLQFPTHLFAECQAVNALENNVHGKFLTPNGFLIGDKPDAVEYLNAGYAFAQIDGAWDVVGGSEPSYSLPPGDTYLDLDVVMVTEAGSPVGVNDVWMTGFVDGACEIDEAYGTVVCDAGVGKVSYLGGHKYEVKTPISDNPDSQGTRLFLNSLFEADCATAEGQPLVTVTKAGPATSLDGVVTWVITVQNFGPTVANNAVVTDVLPAGSVVTDTSPAAVVAGEQVTWDLGTLAAGASETLTVTVTLPTEGSYENVAELAYNVGVNTYTLTTTPVTTVWSGDSDNDNCPDAVEDQQGTSNSMADTDMDGFDDCDDTCPVDANPLQSLDVDPDNCGVCGLECSGDQVVAALCEAGECLVGQCAPGWLDADNDFANGCETAIAEPPPESGADASGSGDSMAMSDSAMSDSGGDSAISDSAGDGPGPQDGGAGDTASDSSGGDGSSGGQGDALVPGDTASSGDGGPSQDGAGAVDVSSDTGGGSDSDTTTGPDDAVGAEDASPDVASDAASDASKGDGGTSVGGDAASGSDTTLDITGSAEPGFDTGIGVNSPAGTDEEGCQCETGRSAPPLTWALLLLAWLGFYRRRTRRQAA